MPGSSHDALKSAGWLEAAEFEHFVATPFEDAMSRGAAYSLFSVLVHETCATLAKGGSPAELPIQLDVAILPSGESFVQCVSQRTSDSQTCMRIIEVCHTLAYPKVKRVFVGSLLAHIRSECAAACSVPFEGTKVHLPEVVKQALAGDSDHSDVYSVGKPAVRQPSLWRRFIDWLEECTSQTQKKLASLLLRRHRLLYRPDDDLDSIRVGYAYQLGPQALDEAIATDPQDPHLLVARAALREDEGNCDGAVTDLSAAIRLKPRAVSALVHRARCWFKLSQYEKALQDANAACALDDSNLWARTLRGKIYFNLQAYEAADTEFTKTISLAPFEFEHWTDRAYARVKLKHWEDDAAADLDRALELNPYDSRALHLRVQLRYERNANEEASNQRSTYVAHLDRLLRYESAEPEILVRRGLICLEARELDDALNYCERALALAPEYPFALAVRGFIREAQNETVAAVNDLDEAVAAGVEWPAVFYRRAYLNGFEGRWESAIRDADCALALDAGMWQAWTLRARVHLGMNEYEQAEEELQRAIHLAPAAAEPHYLLGKMNCDRHQYEEAVESFSEAICLEPLVADGWAARGACYAEQGNLPAALADLNEALQLAPNSDEALTIRAKIYHAQERYQAAREDLSAAMTLDGANQTHLRWLRLHTFMALEEFDLAFQDADELVRLTSECAQSGEFYALRAICWTHLGNRTAAEADFTEAIRCQPELADVFRASALMEAANHELRKQQYPTAIRLAQEALTIRDDCHQARDIKALAYWCEEAYAEAITEYDEMIERVGESRQLLACRGQVLVELDEIDRGLVDLNRSLEMARQAGAILSESHARSGRALAFSSLGRHQDSEVEILAALALYPNCSWHYYYLGRVLDRAGKLCEAAKAFENALEHHVGLKLTTMQRSRASAYCVRWRATQDRNG